MQMFLVGGAVRDEILGVPFKDYDYSVVLHQWNDLHSCFGSVEKDPFVIMRNELVRQGYEIFKEDPEFYTIRARFPKSDHRRGIVGDFVLARVEGPYSDGRHPDWVKPGKLSDDLRRRDFTMNAIAKDGNSLVDPHDGFRDIQRKIVRAVGDPLERLTEDPLRALRALRFAVTKGFSLDYRLADALTEPLVIEGVADKSRVKDERICAELEKMFRKDTVASLRILNTFPALMEAVFSGRVSLDATMKQKGRG